MAKFFEHGGMPPIEEDAWLTPLPETDPLPPVGFPWRRKTNRYIHTM